MEVFEDFLVVLDLRDEGVGGKGKISMSYSNFVELRGSILVFNLFLVRN